MTKSFIKLIPFLFINIIAGCGTAEGNTDALPSNDPGNETGGSGMKPQATGGSTGGTDNAGGAEGLTGPKGDKGDTGEAGPVGPAGPQGPKGDTGATGAAGPVGAQGTPGAQGVAGPQGAPGTPGSVGPQGPQGPAGVPGAKGATGAAGQDGWGRSKADIYVVTKGYSVNMTWPAQAFCKNTKDIPITGGCRSIYALGVSRPVFPADETKLSGWECMPWSMPNPDQSFEVMVVCQIGE